MRKYVLVRTDRYTRDTAVFDSLEKANTEARYIWEKRLTAPERRGTTIATGWVEDTLQFFEPEDLAEQPLDWTLFHDFTGDERCLTLGGEGRQA